MNLNIFFVEKPVFLKLKLQNKQGKPNKNKQRSNINNGKISKGNKVPTDQKYCILFLILNYMCN